MPYLKPEDKKKIYLGTGFVSVFDIKSPGDLNYAFTMIIKDYMHIAGKNYQTINDIIGALEGAKMEFYDRVARPYEDKKLKENGDVYNESIDEI